MRCSSARARDESGAILPMVAVLMTVIVLFAAFAVDLGMQRVLRRDLQAMADVIALDMSRELDGRTQAVLKATNDWRTQLKDSTQRNLNENPVPAVSVQQKQREAIATVAGTDVVITAVMGLIDETTGVFSEIPYPEVPTAVQVTATGSVDFAFVSGSGGATRTAVGTTSQSGCFEIGTMAVGLATNNSALNGLLGNALDTSVLGYNGLANADVSLLGLESELTALDPDGVLDLENVALADIVLAAGTVLSNTPGAETADVQLLGAIATQIQLAGSGNTVVNLADLLDVRQGSGAALDTTVNLLDLVSGGAFIANGEQAIAVPGLNLNLGGLANVTTTLKVIERPRRGCLPGRGTAETSQIGLTISGDLDVTIPLVLSVKGRVEITVDLAEAMGRLTAVTCEDNSAKAVNISVENQSLASTTVDLGDLRARALLGIVNVPLLGLKVSTTQPAPTGNYRVALPTFYKPTPFRTPQTPASLPAVTSTQLSVLGLNLGSILSPVLNLVLNPLLTSINTAILNQLAPALGLRIAGVDLFGVKTPACGSPRLAG